MVVCCHGGTLGCHMWAATHTLQLITFPCSLGHLKALCWGVCLCVHLGKNHKQPSLCALQWLHASAACVSSRPKQLLEVSVLAALPSCDTPCTSGHPQALFCKYSRVQPGVLLPVLSGRSLAIAHYGRVGCFGFGHIEPKLEVQRAW